MNENPFDRPKDPIGDGTNGEASNYGLEKHPCTDFHKADIDGPITYDISDDGAGLSAPARSSSRGPVHLPGRESAVQIQHGREWRGRQAAGRRAGRTSRHQENSSAVAGWKVAAGNLSGHASARAQPVP